jgi:glutaminase
VTGVNLIGAISVQSPIQTYLENLHHELSGLQSGAVASYIPELGKANPNWFGICLVTADGVAYSVGNADQAFTIQSIAKALVYATSLGDRGKDFVSTKVGVEPSGDAFNSISLDPGTNRPLNPMINAGAIATTSLIAGDDAAAQWHRIEQSLQRFAGHELRIDDTVYQSESETGHRNRAIAWMLKNFGIIDGDPMAALENYFRQCSLLVTCRDIAMMAATLANAGVHPITRQRAMPAEHTEQVLSVMATCGMYDYAGGWLSEVGLPAKSGVGGGIMAVLPGRFGIGVFSPLLDDKGNSVRGIEVCKRLARDLGLNIFSPANDPGMALGRIFTGADAPSRRQPPQNQREQLHQRAASIKCLSLHGFLAVDGIEFVIRQMQAMASEANSFVLDMHRVDGLSDSAARLLSQARMGFAADGIAVVFSRIHNRAAITSLLRKPVSRSDRGFLSFEDNDLAVEWCENRLLADFQEPACERGLLGDATLFNGLPERLLHEVEAVSQRQVYAPGAQILVSGQAGDGRLFFIETGHLSILVPLSDGAHLRIATLGPGMVFGEMVLLGQTTRSASVFADSEVTCKIIEASELERISGREPLLKITLLENLGRDLASKLRVNAQWIKALG